MATVEDRYNAATDYVRHAIAVVEAAGIGYVVDPVTGAIEWYAARTKTAEPRNELARLDARWLRAASDVQRAALAREAELLADRVEESLPGAPQDRARTNLYAGEVPHGTPATTYGQEVESQAGEVWQWAEDKATSARGAASSVGKWILVAGGGFLGWKALDYLATRERARLQRAAGNERRALNAALEQVAERRSRR